MDVRRGVIPLLCSTIREAAFAEGFSFNMVDTRYTCVCRSTKLSGSEKMTRCN